MTHERGFKDASHDVRVCVCMCIGCVSHLALKCVDYWTSQGLQYYTLQRCFPAEELHTLALLTLNVAFKSAESSQSDQDWLKDRSRATEPPLMQSTTEADSCAYKGQMSSWCKIAVLLLSCQGHHSPSYLLLSQDYLFFRRVATFQLVLSFLERKSS